ncbi:hypothetical protein POL68_20260 [Stigmatella sp. ncwal1]|uniref:Uncharacterized protein n=1 Tax=Stigmatella ashevillensis TaxID=2995309 RepID=A0ABT5DAW1_9BACT|nr:hypothetical protein [Stigmatella ashevillena]MDC0710820.1 hypothetical protein [Stigmatella ashevillena]
MRRLVLIAACLATAASACRTTQPPGTENQMPIDAVGPEPVQSVPAETPGPAEPITAPPEDGGTP